MRLDSQPFSLAAARRGLLVAAVAGAAMIGIYRNGMETTAQRAQLVKLAGASCARGGSDGALRIAIGKATDACSYRTPVLGRDLEIAATERLLSGTPKALQRKAYLGARAARRRRRQVPAAGLPAAAQGAAGKVTADGSASTWRSPRTSKR